MNVSISEKDLKYLRLGVQRLLKLAWKPLTVEEQEQIQIAYDKTSEENLVTRQKGDPS